MKYFNIYDLIGGEENLGVDFWEFSLLLQVVFDIFLI